MSADGADFGGFVASEDVAAVATLPDGNFFGFEDDIIVDIAQKFSEAGFVLFFDVADLFELFCDILEAFGAGGGGEVAVHVGIFIGFAVDGGLEIFFGRANAVFE